MRRRPLLHPPFTEAPILPFTAPLSEMLSGQGGGMYVGFENLRLGLVSAEGPPEGDGIATFHNLLSTS
jgi:hypothetical protein